MFAIAGNTGFLLYNQTTEMRKSFNGLEGGVLNERGQGPLSDDVYVLINKRKTMIKFLLWERTGYWLLYKRLELGRFQERTVETSWLRYFDN